MDGPRVIADRYTLRRLLGRGGSGAVWLADDTHAARPVAVKLLAMAVDADLGQLARELAALEALEVPGVARLLDHGQVDGRAFLVLDYIDGDPFPGAFGDSWERLAIPTTALLHTLAAMHAAGVVHRDLKPDNVLVDAQGRPTVLDFGLARVGSGEHTRSGMVLGTPAWQAPEQMMGEVADARTDLYALGLMLFAALADGPAHPGTDPQSLMWQRLMEPTPSLAERAPATPEHVVAVVDRLLARERADRLASAEETLAGLAAAQRSIPEMGDPALWMAVADALRAGRGVSVGGPSGSGRTWCLDRVSGVLADEGCAVLRLRPAEAVFASLTGVLEIDALAGEGGATLPTRVAAALAERLAAGAVLLADDGVDPWTAEILAHTPGPIARVVDGPADVTLRPWTEAELRPLFAGPDRILHLQTDGAQALHRRTGGLARRVVEQVRRWVAGQIARWTDRGLYVSREMLLRLASRPATLVEADQPPLAGALGRLTAWLHLCWPHTGLDVLDAVIDQPRWAIEVMLASLVQREAARQLDDGRYEPQVPATGLQSWTEADRLAAQRRIGAALPAGAEGRLRHVRATGTRQAIVMEVLAQARRLADLGRTAGAVGLLLDALTEAQDQRSDMEETLVELSISEQGPDLRTRVANALTQPPLRLMMHAALEVGASRVGPALEELDTRSPFGNPRLEQARTELRVAARLRTGRSDEAAALLDALPAPVNPAFKAQWASWRGLIAYQRLDFARAARLHREAMAHPSRRLKAGINLAFALLEDFRFDEAARAAADLLTEARSRRLAVNEAFAWRLLRSARYRAEHADVPDEQLVEAALHVCPARLAALIALNEAAFAWRMGHPALSLLLAPPRALQQRAVSVLARALDPREDDLAAVSMHALEVGMPRIRLQISGLLAMRGFQDARLTQCVPQDAASVPRVRWDARLEVISVHEALHALGMARAQTVDHAT